MKLISTQAGEAVPSFSSIRFIFGSTFKQD